jgi:glycosyltransferase involved in cell wall biosynthesis
VLVTVYNRESYLPAALDSVLSQRYTDFEVLVVDDCSTDGSITVARDYERRDPRVRVVENAHNLGQFANRNHAATLARGRFLKYHDSDDVMYPHCLETMVDALEHEPRAAFALSASRAWSGGAVPMLLSPRECYQREFLGFGMFNNGPASALFRTEMFRALGGFRDVGVHADYLFWLDACARYSVVLVSGDLFWYREHDGQALQSAGAARDYAAVPGEVWRKLQSADCPLQGEELELAKRNQTANVAKHILRDLRAGRWGLAEYRLRRSAMSVADWVKYLRRPVRRALAGAPQR